MAKFFTWEDLKIAFSFFCCVYGIGTLGIPANFARAGPVYATIALLFMAFSNVCSCVAVSKVMLAAPKSVKTYGDLGEWCCGRFGRYIVVTAQFGVCLMVPCAFLVLGGILLREIIPNAFSQQVWSVIMALSLLPVILTPTLKEGAMAALAGCLGTVFADFIALFVLVDRIGDHPAVIAPEFKFKEVVATFGNLALAYSAAVLVPALQREHSQPERMPRVVGATMIFTSALFLTIGVTAYHTVGCQVPGNLLFAIAGTSLNLNTSRSTIVLAYMFMQLHITIAMSVILNPVLYIAERSLLGMHKRPRNTEEQIIDEESQVPFDGGLQTPPLKEKESMSEQRASTRRSVVSLMDAERDSEVDLAAEYRDPKNIVKFVVLRCTIVGILLAFAVAFHDHFIDISDFVGASAISMGCIILPIFFYLKTFWKKLPWYQRIIGSVIIIVCGLCGGYMTYSSGKAL
ncbi:TPA: hypothetical protein N0F65_000515, partial [Lagenidium giganteum]